MRQELPEFTLQEPLPAPATPTPAQLARRQALRRFNRRYVHLPLALVAVLWLLLIVVMLWLSLVGDWFAIDTNQEYFRSLFSGVADFVIIFVVSVACLLVSIPVGLSAYLYRRRREKRKAQPAGPPALPLMWRIENFVDARRVNVSRAMNGLARPVIRAHATGSYVRTIVLEIKRMFRRS